MLKALAAVLCIGYAYAQTDLSVNSCSDEPQLISGPGVFAATIQFINSTDKTVRVYWRNYNGQRVRYSVLTPGNQYTQPTFASHVWVITDTTDQCLAIFVPGSGANRANISSSAIAAPVRLPIVQTFAGTDWVFSGNGGPATDAPLAEVNSVAVDGSGNVYASDAPNGEVMRISPDGTLTVFAGNAFAGFSGDGGPATSASLSNPAGLAVDVAGNIYISDRANQRVRKIASDGTISTFAGNGRFGFSGDNGPATSAMLSGPDGLAFDGQGNLYIVEAGGHRIRKVAPDGTITTVAGTGQPGFSGDGGPATAAMLNTPRRIAADGSGNLYVVDAVNQRVRKIGTDGVITTFAGTGKSGPLNDGGPASNAALFFVSDVAVDAAGNVLILTSSPPSVRQVTPDGIIQTIVGSGLFGFAGDGGPALKARFSFPGGFALGSDGSLYIADSSNRRIRKVTPDGNVQTIAGNFRYRFSPDGTPALFAYFNNPARMTLDPRSLSE